MNKEMKMTNAETMSPELELNETELEEVSGGFGLGGALLVIGGCYVAGRIYGYYAGKKTGLCP